MDRSNKIPDRRDLLICEEEQASSSSIRGQKRITMRFGVRRLILGALVLSLIALSLSPISSNSAVEAAKKGKEKKLLKSLVKELIFKNLSTKKNILPMPAPIPGKWQQILNAVLDSSLAYADKHKKYSSSSATASSAVALGATKKNKANKLGRPNKAMTLDDVKKYTRYTAAKLTKMININRTPNESSSLAKPAGLGDNQIKKAGASSSGGGDKPSPQKQHDVLVTAFNLAKLIRQIKELNSSRLLNLSRKSGGNGAFSSSQGAHSLNENTVIPIVSMNINNKKSFNNKMNYIRKLTAHYRQSRGHNHQPQQQQQQQQQHLHLD